MLQTYCNFRMKGELLHRVKFAETLEINDLRRFFFYTDTEICGIGINRSNKPIKKVTTDKFSVIQKGGK